MSVLVKGMEMPRDCEECRFCEVIDGLGCMATHYLILRRHGQDKPNWCPLVAVPTPHGRLIDADELIVFEAHVDGAQNGLRFVPAEFIEAAPTIIEAEEGADHERPHRRTGGK